VLISGVDAGELAQAYGTPLLVINVDAVDAAIASLHVACAPKDVEISYAAKAFICVAFARHLSAHSSIGLDVCSLGELLTAERAGFPPERLTLHGAGKSDAELCAAVAGRVGRIVVDSLEELERLASLDVRDEAGADGATPTRVMLRLNTGISAPTHPFLRTGGNETKFGLAERDEAAATSILTANPQLRFIGLHAHVGSQIYESAPFVANSHALVEAAKRFTEYGLIVDRIVIGGGFGVQVQPDSENHSLDVTSVLSDVARCVRECTSALGMSAPRVGIEPGRAIVANAGTTLYRVLAVKRHIFRTFVVVDGGIFENPRPAIYGAFHYVSAVTPRAGPLQEMTLCGRSCENDELGQVRLPEDIAAGDLLAMRTTGAYTYSMSSNYNRFVRPAVTAVQAGTHAPWIRREMLDEVLANDVDVHPTAAAKRS
jgi:diaminopimelate decarboxylase